MNTTQKMLIFLLFGFIIGFGLGKYHERNEWEKRERKVEIRVPGFQYHQR